MARSGVRPYVPGCACVCRTVRGPQHETFATSKISLKVRLPGSIHRLLDAGSWLGLSAGGWLMLSQLRGVRCIWVQIKCSLTSMLCLGSDTLDIPQIQRMGFYMESKTEACR